MVNKPDKNEARLRRHRRVRGKISGTAERPRLDVFRSSKHIYAQIIDDVAGVTLVSASTMEKGFEGFGGNVEAANKVGKMIAERPFVSFESIGHAIDKCVPARKAHLVEANKRAIALGRAQ